MDTTTKRQQTVAKALLIIEKANPSTLKDYQKELILAVLESVFETGSLEGFKEAFKQIEEIRKKDEEIEEDEGEQYTPEEWELEGLGDLI